MRRMVLLLIVIAPTLVAIPDADAHNPDPRVFNGTFVWDRSDGRLPWRYRANFPADEKRDRAFEMTQNWNDATTGLWFARTFPDFPANTNWTGSCSESSGASRRSMIDWKNIPRNAEGKEIVGWARFCEWPTNTPGVWEKRGFLLRFDSDPEGWTWYTGTGTPADTKLDFKSVAAHEFGHARAFHGGAGEDDPEAGAHFNRVSAHVCPRPKDTNFGKRETMCPFVYMGTKHQQNPEFHDVYVADRHN